MESPSDDMSRFKIIDCSIHPSMLPEKPVHDSDVDTKLALHQHLYAPDLAPIDDYFESSLDQH